jgi:hypothetical protein
MFTRTDGSVVQRSTRCEVTLFQWPLAWITSAAAAPQKPTRFMSSSPITALGLAQKMLRQRLRRRRRKFLDGLETEWSFTGRLTYGPQRKSPPLFRTATADAHQAIAL